MTRYTPEAIAALVKAAEDLLPDISPYSEKEGALAAALRPFTTEAPSWSEFCHGLWGDGWYLAHVPIPNKDGRRGVSGQEYVSTKASYRARFGVEPVWGLFRPPVGDVVIDTGGEV